MNLASLNSTARCQDKHNFIIVTGNIAAFKNADILVNPVSIGNTDLKSSGEVPKAFYEIGKEQLQKMFEKAGPPKCPGYDVTVTEPAGTICCKKIFHAAVAGYHDGTSVESLKLMIAACLSKAESFNMSSIAFPTVGCGERKYHTFDVAHCFIQAAKETKTKLQIYIVAFTDEFCHAFMEIFTTAEESGRQPGNLNAMPTAGSSLAVISKNSSRRFDESRAIRYVKDSRKFSASAASLNTVSSDKEFLGRPDNTPLGQIKSLRKLRIGQTQAPSKIDTDQSTITLTMTGELAHKFKQEVLKLMVEDELMRKNLNFIKITKGDRDYLMALSQSFPDHLHDYTFPDLTTLESKRSKLVNGSPAYDAVEAFILNTWKSSEAGHGRDASGLDGPNIAVKNIWTIESPFLFIKYRYQLKAFALKAADKPFSSVTSLGEPEIMTKQIAGVNYLNDKLISNVNEVYLMHGTSHVDEIVKGGIDCRFNGPHGSFFGKGAYFAESSTKADQYARQPLFMFVARVLLGEPFISREYRSDLRKAPCSAPDCKKDNCPANHQMCDSVIGTHSNPSTPLLFREFIVYHPEQCYPEFLVEYAKQ